MLNLMRGLAARGHHCALVAGFPRERVGQAQINFPWEPFYPVPMDSDYSTVRYGLEFAWKAPRVVAAAHQQERFDLIHGHSGLAVHALTTVRAARRTRLHSAQTICCPLMPSGGWSWKDVITRRALASVDLVMAVSQNVARSLQGAGVRPERLQVVPMCVDVGALTAEQSCSPREVSLPAQNGSLRLLYVGNSAPAKGLAVLIESFARVAAAVPEAHLVVCTNYEQAGWEVYRQGIASRVAALGLRDRITFLGFIDNMKELMRSAAVLVAPFTTTQGPTDFPLVVLEALVLGKAVVASRVGGLPEIIEEGVSGWLVPPRDEETLAERLISVLQTPEARERAGAVAAERSAGLFCRDRVAETTEGLYRRLLAAPGRYARARREPGDAH
jgi:glycosyltransferase involved in cell wall biosynthesis